jgi:hypothetical protein
MKSPVRENCTPGSVRGLSGNWQSYRDLRSQSLDQQNDFFPGAFSVDVFDALHGF